MGASALIERLREAPSGSSGMRPVKSPLTAREWDVNDLLREAKTTDEIADELVLSPETIRSHVKHIPRKLDVRSCDDAVAVADQMRNRAPAIEAPERPGSRRLHYMPGGKTRAGLPQAVHGEGRRPAASQPLLPRDHYQRIRPNRDRLPAVAQMSTSRHRERRRQVACTGSKTCSWSRVSP